MDARSEEQVCNHRLKALFMEVVQNQINDNNPSGTRQTCDRLIAQGISDEDARKYIAQAVATEVWDILHNNNTFNPQRFITNLSRLPEEPEAGSQQED